MNKTKTSPIVWFVLVGALLFGLDYLLSTRQTAEKNPNFPQRAEMVEDIVNTYKKIAGTAPDSALLEDLLEQRLQQEVLLQYGIQQELYTGNAVIRDELTQLSAQHIRSGCSVEDPGDATLKDFLQSHQQQFMTPERWSVTVYRLPNERRMLNAIADSNLLRNYRANVHMDCSTDSLVRAYGPAVSDTLLLLDQQRVVAFAEPPVYRVIHLQHHQPSQPQSLEAHRAAVLKSYRLDQQQDSLNRFVQQQVAAYRSSNANAE